MYEEESNSTVVRGEQYKPSLDNYTGLARLFLTPSLRVKHANVPRKLDFVSLSKRSISFFHTHYI